jgi:hypothetical protein
VIDVPLVLVAVRTVFIKVASIFVDIFLIFANIAHVRFAVGAIPTQILTIMPDVFPVL